MIIEDPTGKIIKVPDNAERIPGSRCYRVYCQRCAAPMRVLASRINVAHYCEDCDPPEPLAPYTGMSQVPREYHEGADLADEIRYLTGTL